MSVKQRAVVALPGERLVPDPHVARKRRAPVVPGVVRVAARGEYPGVHHRQENAEGKPDVYRSLLPLLHGMSGGLGGCEGSTHRDAGEGQGGTDHTGQLYCLFIFFIFFIIFYVIFFVLVFLSYLLIFPLKKKNANENEGGKNKQIYKRKRSLLRDEM